MCILCSANICWSKNFLSILPVHCPAVFSYNVRNGYSYPTVRYIVLWLKQLLLNKMLYTQREEQCMGSILASVLKRCLWYMKNRAGVILCFFSHLCLIISNKAQKRSKPTMCKSNCQYTLVPTEDVNLPCRFNFLQISYNSMSL